MGHLLAMQKVVGSNPISRFRNPHQLRICVLFSYGVFDFAGRRPAR